MPREGAQHAAEAEYEKPGRDHGLAPVTVRETPEGDLEQRLGQAVDAHRHTDEERSRACQLLGVQGQHG